MSDIVVGIRLKADGSGFVGEMKLAEVELDRVTGATKRTKTEAERFVAALQDEIQAIGKTRNELLMLRASKLGVADAAAPLINQINRFEQVASRPRTLAEGFQQLQTATVMAGISVYALTQAVMASGAALFESQIKLDKFNALMRAGLGAGAQQAAEHLDYVRSTAYRLGLDLNSTAMGYAKLTAAARGTELEGKNTRLVFEGVSTATAAMAMTAAETDGVLLALTQMLSKGRVSAEELTGQLGERMPGALNIASRAMGVSTQELYKMMEQGKLMASDFLPKFAIQLKKELGGAAAEASGNAQASLNRFYGALEKLKQSIVGSGLGKNMTAQIGLAANSMSSLADHIDVATSALKTGAEIAGVYLLIFKGAPIAIGATSAALTAVVAQVRMAQLAMAIGLPASQLFWSAMNGGAAGFVASSAASVAAIGALKLAMGGLFAAFVGWEIGSWLRDNFVEARVAGLAFVSVMLKGWEYLKYGANVAWEGIKAGFRGAFSAIGGFYADLYSKIASGLKTIGAEGAGSSLQGFADNIRTASRNTGDFSAAQARLKTQLDANLGAIDENIQGLVDYEMGVEGSTKASGKAAAAADHLKKKKKELSDEQKKAIEKIAEVKAGLEFEIAQLGRSAREQAIYNSLKQAGASINSAAGKAIAATAGLLYDEQQAVKRAEQAYQDLMQTLSELRGEGAKYQQSMAREEKQVLDLVDAAEFELQTIGLQKSAITSLTIEKLEATRASWLLWEAEVGVAGAAADEIASIDKKIAGYRRLRDVYVETEQKTKTLETVKRIADGIESTFHDATQDIVTQGKLDFDAFWKAVAISFKTQVADEIYKLTVGRIVVNVIGSFAGGAANAAGTAVAAGGNVAQQGLGIMSGVQGAWSAYNGGMASMASGFATSSLGQSLGLSTAGQMMGPPTAGGAMGWTTTGATMTGAGSNMAAAAGPLAAALAAAVTLAEMNKGGWGRDNNTEGYAKSMVTGGVGTNIAWDRLFGHNRKISDDAAGISGTIDLGGFSGQNYQERSQKGGTFRSDRRWTENSAVADDLDGYIDSLVRQTVSGVQTVGKALGLETENAMAGFSHSFQLQLTENGSWDKAGEKITAELGKVNDELATRLLPNIEDFRRYGESASQTLIRLNAEFAGTDAILQMLGKTAEQAFGMAGMASAEARERLIDYAGGMEQLATKTASFYQHYFTEEERSQQAAAAAQRQINDAFGALGIAVPKSTAEFKQLVMGQDLSTEAGAKLFNQLLDLESAFYATQQATDAAAKAAKEATDAARGQQAGLFDRYATDTQKTAAAQGELNRVFGEFGRAVPKTHADMVRLVQSLDPANAADQRLLKSLNELTGAFDIVASGATDAAQKQISAMQSVTAQMDKITSYKAGISSAQFDIRSKMPSFNAVGYYADQGSKLRSQLAGASTLDQRLGLGEQLKTSILNRYQAEQDAVNKNREAIKTDFDKRLQEQQALLKLQQQGAQSQQTAARQWNDSMLRMRDYANSLLLTDASPLSPEARLSEAERQYTAMLQRAKGGDADAAGQLQNNAQSYLSAARDYYASGANYSAIFDMVQSSIASLGASAQNPAELDAAFQQQSLSFQTQSLALDTQWQQMWDAQSRQWQADDEILAQNTIDELNDLQMQADAWNDELRHTLQEQAINGVRQTEYLSDVATNTRDLDIRIATAIAGAMTALQTQITALSTIQAKSSGDLVLLTEQTNELLYSLDRTTRLESA